MRSLKHRVKYLFNKKRKDIGKTVRVTKAARHIRTEKEIEFVMGILEKKKRDLSFQKKDITLTSQERMNNVVIKAKIQVIDDITDQLLTYGKTTSTKHE